jgi:hypothetical protein
MATSIRVWNSGMWYVALVHRGFEPRHCGVWKLFCAWRIVVGWGVGVPRVFRLPWGCVSWDWPGPVIPVTVTVTRGKAASSYHVVTVPRAALVEVDPRGPIHSVALGSVLARGFPHGPRSWGEMGVISVLSGGISGHAHDPTLWVEGIVALVLSGGKSGRARDPIPPSAVGTVNTGRWPYGPDSPSGPAAAILLTAGNQCVAGLSLLFEYVHWY